MRRIPSEKTLAQQLSGVLEKARARPGAVQGEDNVRYSIRELRKLLVRWRDGGIRSHDMLETADDILDGHGVEYIANADDEHYIRGGHGAYYVNMGDTYTPTILLDLDRGAVFAIDYGTWVEREERAGKKFS